MFLREIVNKILSRPEKTEAISKLDLDALKNTPRDPHGFFVRHEELGSGAMATVYRATEYTHFEGVKEHAVKIANDEQYEEAHRLEWALLKRLEHPNIVRPHTYADDPEVKGMAMEIIRGTRLDTLIKEKRLDLPQIVSICQQLCDVIDYLFSQGVIHRDLKPTNIMIQSNGQLKVLDFVLAHPIFNTDDVYGTINYMPVESVDSGQNMNRTSELYHVGVILYECIVGETFKSRDIMEALQQTRQFEYYHFDEGRLIDALEAQGVPTDKAQRINSFFSKNLTKNSRKHRESYKLAKDFAQEFSALFT